MPDDDDRLDEVFTDALGSAPANVADEDATFRQVVRQARRRVRQRRIGAAALATAVVGTVAITVAGAAHHSIPESVHAAPPSSTVTSAASASATTTTTELGRGMLGVEIANSDGRVIGTEPGTPAAQAGLKPGDRIVSIDGMHITSPSTITITLEHTHPHDTIHLAWVDAHGRQHAAAVQLAAQPEK